MRQGNVEATLAELGRNEALRRLIGIAREENVPKSWNISRFLDTLDQEPHRSELRRIFDAMVERLGAVVPDLGQDTAGDSTALHARRLTGRNAAVLPTSTRMSCADSILTGLLGSILAAVSRQPPPLEELT